MKIKAHFLLFFLICLNNHSNTAIAFAANDNLNFKQVRAVKKDSVSKIPKSFLELQKNSNGYCLVNGNPTKKQIALTFDDGPTEVSQKIIKILNKYNAKASFFWVGERIKGNKKIIQSAKQGGYLIANHSWNHENGYLSSNQLLWETQVEKTLQEFAANGISNSRFYRPPFGAITQEQINFLASKNIKTVLWSITSMDWDPNQNKVGQMFQKFKEQMHPGAIVLFHDYDYSNLDAKLNDLENILKFGINNGYQFVTVAAINL